MQIYKLDKERILNQGEISSLINDKKKLDNELKLCEKELEKKGEEIKRYIETIYILRKEKKIKRNRIKFIKDKKEEVIKKENQLEEYINKYGKERHNMNLLVK